MENCAVAASFPFALRSSPSCDPLSRKLAEPQAKQFMPTSEWQVLMGRRATVGFTRSKQQKMLSHERTSVRTATPEAEVPDENVRGDLSGRLPTF